MLRRCLILAVVCGAAALGGIWQGKARAVHPVPMTADFAIWGEYGLEAAEAADLGAYRATAYRFKDTTGSFAAYQWIRSTDRNARLLGRLVVTCAPGCPRDSQLTPLLKDVPASPAIFPSLPAYLPKPGRIDGSERYILGPASLSRFAPELPVDAMAFQFSSEGAIARYRAGPGEQTLAIVSFPTPGIARQQATQFERIAGAMVRRSGPLVVLIVKPADPEASSRLLSEVRYQASINWDEKPADPKLIPKVASMLLGIAQLTGFLLLLCLAGGVAVAGSRMARRRFGDGDASDRMIVLHLSDR